MPDRPRNLGDSVNGAMEKHWSALSTYERLDLLRGLGIDGKDEEILGGRNIVEVLRLDQDNLPNEVRGRLLTALTVNGFSVEEFQRHEKALNELIDQKPQN
jgi:hypothetical protein